MTAHIVGFELGFPEAWHPVPRDVPDVAGWARSTARELVSGYAPDLAGATAGDVTDVLTEQLEAVVESVRATGVTGLRAAVLVRHPGSGVVDAMVTVGAQRGITAEAYAGELDEIVRTSATQEFVNASALSGTSAAGPVAGVHTFIAHPGELGDAESAVLEERVVLGAFPQGTGDMVEITAVARSVGTFDDMPQAIVDLFAGLTVEVGQP